MGGGCSSVTKSPVFKRGTLFKRPFCENRPFFALFCVILPVFCVILSIFYVNSPMCVTINPINLNLGGFLGPGMDNFEVGQEDIKAL